MPKHTEPARFAQANLMRQMHSHNKVLSKSSREIDAHKGVGEVSMVETLLLTTLSILDRSKVMLRHLRREKQ